MPTLSSKPPSDLKINAGNKTEIKLKRTTMIEAKKTINETGFCPEQGRRIDFDRR